MHLNSTHNHQISNSRRHRDVVLQSAVFAEAHLGLALAGVGLYMDVGGALLVGVDDDLVDELDDLVIRRGRRNILVVVLQRLVVLQSRQQISDFGAIVERADARRPAAAAKNKSSVATNSRAQHTR